MSERADRVIAIALRQAEQAIRTRGLNVQMTAVHAIVEGDAEDPFTYAMASHPSGGDWRQRVILAQALRKTADALEDA